MRRPALAIAMLALVASAAMAEEWAGTWAADPAWCEGEGAGAPIRITTEAMHGLGNVCEITNVSPTGVGQSWRFDMSCSGEGMPYRTSEMIMLALDGALIRYTADGVLVRMVRCE
ncbi:MAG TPA: hypothetical protein VFJ13_11680 [Paracoccaceae bacterium]|nr:hypothetical protein [Paracoccaceae bacterium]